MVEPAKTAIFPAPVGKLPIVERLPAIPVAAGVVPVNIAPAAFEPTAGSSFRTTGDSSPVIFGPSAGRAVAVYKPRKGGAIPTVPAADGAARFTSSYRKRILLSSLYFCHEVTVHSCGAVSASNSSYRRKPVSSNPVRNEIGRRCQFLDSRFRGNDDEGVGMTVGVRK